MGGTALSTFGLSTALCLDHGRTGHRGSERRQSEVPLERSEGTQRCLERSRGGYRGRSRVTSLLVALRGLLERQGREVNDGASGPVDGPDSASAASVLRACLHVRPSFSGCPLVSLHPGASRWTSPRRGASFPRVSGVRCGRRLLRWHLCELNTRTIGPQDSIPGDLSLLPACRRYRSEQQRLSTVTGERPRTRR